MIWSVSTSARSSTDTLPETTLTGSISVTSAGRPEPRLDGVAGIRPVVCSDVDEVPFDGRRGGHLRGDEVRAAAAALAALEVAVRGRGAALAGLEDVRVHAQAHRAAGAAPVEAGGAEDLVEPLGLGLGGDRLGAGHDHGVDVARDLATLDQRGGGAQVADAAVGAGADEHAVEADLPD